MQSRPLTCTRCRLLMQSSRSSVRTTGRRGTGGRAHGFLPKRARTHDTGNDHSIRHTAPTGPAALKKRAGASGRSNGAPSEFKAPRRLFQSGSSASLPLASSARLPLRVRRRRRRARQRRKTTQAAGTCMSALNGPMAHGRTATAYAQRSPGLSGFRNRTCSCGRWSWVTEKTTGRRWWIRRPCGGGGHWRMRWTTAARGRGGTRVRTPCGV